MFRALAYGISLCVFTVSALAAEPAAAPKNPDAQDAAVAAEAAKPEDGDKTAGAWSGSAELGGTVTTGNSETESLNGKAAAQYERGRWRHIGKAEALYSSDAGVDTAERYVASYQANRKMSRRSYVFGAVRGEIDEFSGYDYRVSESVGYGRRFWEAGDKGYFDLEAGPGLRQSKPEDGVREDHGIVRVAAAYRNKWTPNTEFSEDLIVEAGTDNTFTESVTGYKVRINSSLAMKLSYTIKHNTDVPTDQEKTDTISAINLVYDF